MSWRPFSSATVLFYPSNKGGMAREAIAFEEVMIKSWQEPAYPHRTIMLEACQETKSDIAPQRSRGSVSLSVRKTERGSQLEDLFQQGCAKVRFPKTHTQKHLEAVMINTAGGITGGDDLSWRFTAEKEACLTVSSQACERLYRSSGGSAHISVELNAKPGSTLAWLPQETILFDGSAGHRKIQVQMAGSARLLMVEPLIMGRKAMGEAVSSASFRDEWQIICDEKCVHMEATRLDGNIQNLLQRSAVLGDNIAMATVLLIAPAADSDLDRKLEKVRSLCPSTGAASLWQVGGSGKLVARVVASDGYELRKSLVPILENLMDDADLPRCWSV